MTGCNHSETIWTPPTDGHYPDQNPHNESGLAVDWRDTLGRMLQRSATAFKEGALIGLFLGDELLCSGIPLSNYSAVAEAAKSILGTLGVPAAHSLLWGNECQLIFSTSTAGKIYSLVDKQLPAAVGLFSVDMYLGGDTAFPQLSEANLTRQFLAQNVVPKMHPRQQLFLVPGLFADRNESRSGNLSHQSSQLLDKLDDYDRWLSTDPTVDHVPIAGLAPWHFENTLRSFGSIFDSIYSLGFEALPSVTARVAGFARLIPKMGGLVAHL